MLHEAGEFHEREHGVAAEPARNSTGVAVDTVYSAVPVAQVAADAGDHAERKTRIQQHRTLFDVDLDVAVDVVGPEPGPACLEGAGVEPQLVDVLGQTAPGVRAPDPVVVCGVEQPEGHAAAGVVTGEPDDLLGPDRHHREIAFRTPSQPLQPVQGGHAADDSRRAVEVAAMTDGVHVRAHDDPGCGAVTSGQGGVLVAGVVVGDLERQLLRPLGDEPVREVLAVAVGGASDPGRVRRVLVQVLEDLLRLRDFGRPGHAARFPDARAISTAQRTPSSTGTGSSSAMASAIPDSGPPPMITAPAPSSATACAQASANALR